jgi:hypothetical protein
LSALGTLGLSVGRSSRSSSRSRPGPSICSFLSASLEHTSYRETKRYLAEHGPGDDRPQGHPFSKSEFFGQPLPAEVITALIENLEEKRVPGQSRELDFTPWGGPYNRVRADVTAFVHRDEVFLIQHAVVVDPDVSATEREAARSWLARS